MHFDGGKVKILTYLYNPNFKIVIPNGKPVMPLTLKDPN
jgi:hypothetical protein